MSEMSRSISTGVPPLPEGSSPGRKRWIWLVAIPAAVVLAVGATWLFAASRGGDSAVASLPRAEVERGPMTVTITEDGEIEAEEQQIIRNELNWSAIIVELFPEGKVIHKGDTAIRFECDKLLDTITEQQMRVQQAEDDYKAAVTSYDIKKMDLDARVVQAGYMVEDAEANLAKYTEAEWDQLKKEAQGSIDEAKGDLELARHKLEAKLKINADPELKQPYSQSEIDREKLTVAKLQRALDRAIMDKDILHKYTHPRRLRNLQTAVEDAKRELVSAKAEQEKQLALAKTQKETKAYALKDAKDKLAERIEDRDKWLDIKAERTGLLIYETRRRPWHRPIPVAVGEEINPRQQLMIIPDASTMVVKTRVYESVREQVYAGLPARIRLDARSDKTLMGTVSKVAVLPDNQNPWLSPGVKVYVTTVTFNDEVTELDVKPGMTCDVSITLAKLPDVLSVPIAAVFSDQDVTYCYRVGDDGAPHRVDVQLGMTSETRAQIKSGLNEHDVVLLVPPPGERIRRKQPAEKPDEEAATMPGMNGNGSGNGGGRGGLGHQRRGERGARPTGRPGGRGEAGATSRPASRPNRRDGRGVGGPRRSRSGGGGGRGPR